MMRVVVLARRINDRLHLTELKGEVPMHADLVDALLTRCIQRGVNVDPEEIGDSILAKGVY